MRPRTFFFGIAALSIGYLVLVEPEVVVFAVMLLGAIALWRFTRRTGVRR